MEVNIKMNTLKIVLLITLLSGFILFAEKDSTINNDTISTIIIDTSSNSAKAIKDYIKKTWGLDKCKDISDINCMKSKGWEYKQKSLKYVKRKLKNATSERFIKDRDDFYLKYKEGDIIYFYNSSKITWERSMGSQGYIIIRNDSLIAEITTMVN
jgi:hypothetical protein